MRNGVTGYAINAPRPTRKSYLGIARRVALARKLHECYVVQVGPMSTSERENEKFEVFSTKKFIKMARSWNSDNIFKSVLRSNDIRAIDNAATAFVDQTNFITGLSTVKTRTKKNHSHRVIDYLEGEGDNVMKKPLPQKKLTRFVDDFKSGIQENDKERPGIEDFVKKAEDKLRKLNRPDTAKAKACIDEIHGSRERARALFPDLKTFKKLVLSTSNNAAKDTHGHSLKVIKTLLRSSETALRFLYEICAACARTGYVPVVLKCDLITFLYKNKGSRNDAGNYRPITIAPSLGKCMDTVILHFLSLADDLNDDNHAYTSGKSCQTAILKLLEYIKVFRRRAKQAKKAGKRLIPLIFAEDISGAF